MTAIKKQTFRERSRSVLKSIWYSPRFRAVAFAPVDALERARGRDPLLPPRRLQYVGRREDFARQYLGPLLAEARKLGMDAEQVKKMIDMWGDDA